MEFISMSRKVSWLLLVGVAVLAVISLIVYSRQSARNASPSVADARPEKPALLNAALPQSTPTPDDSKPKEMCTLNTSQSPDIGGLRLGMTTAEVLAMFPGSAEDPLVRSDVNKPVTQFGEGFFAIKPDAYGVKPEFAGIRQLSFGLFDGKVSSISAGYDGPKWKHVDEFVAKFVEGRSLPNAWEAYPGMDNQRKSLKCDGFEVVVFAGGKTGNANSVRLVDLAATKKLEERRAKAIEKAKQETKP
jgi:hypothetical protein